MSYSSQEFKQWVTAYSDELYSWAKYKTSSKEIAEDLVQDTFMAAYHKIDSFQGKSKPKTWLFSILNNKIIDHYRKKSKVSIQSIDHERIANSANDDLFDDAGYWKTTSDTTEEHWLDNPDFNSVLVKCLENLPSNWQFAMRSKYLLNKKSTEICETLEIKPTNYWQIVHRSKLALRQCIENQWVNQ